MYEVIHINESVLGLKKFVHNIMVVLLLCEDSAGQKDLSQRQYK